jgi:O-antigen ligase
LYSNIYDQVIVSVSLFLVVFAPLAFGAVQEWALSIVRTAVLVLLVAWLFKWISQRRLGFIIPPFSLAAVLFVLLVIFQLVPLPASWRAFLSAGPSSSVQSGVSTSHDSEPADHSWKSLTLNSGATRTGLINLLVCLAFCLVLLNHFVSLDKMGALVFALVGVGSFEALYGLFEYWSGQQNIFWYKKVYYLEEVTGTYINHNHFAGLMELTIPLAVATFAVECSRHFSNGGARFFSSLKQLSFATRLKLLGMLTAIGAMSVGLVLSKSRVGLVASIVSLATLAALVQTKRKSSSRALQVAIGLTLICGLLTIRFDRGPIERFSWWQDEAQIRFDLWKDSIRIVPDFPLLGRGLGTFKEVIPYYRSRLDFVRISDAPHGAFWNHAHNDYLQLLIECGAIGFFFVAWGLVQTTRQLLSGLARHADWRIATIGYAVLSGMMALLIHSFFDFNFHIPANALVFSALLGLCLILASGSTANRPSAPLREQA